MKIPTENELLAARIFDPALPTADRVRIQFDWTPALVDGRITFRVGITRGQKHSSIEFEVDLARFSAAQFARLYGFLGQRHAGLTSALDVALAAAWLLDLSLCQEQPSLSKPDRDAKVKIMLLAQSDPPSTQGSYERTRQPAAPHITDPPFTLGVSPLLIWIRPRRRTWLSKHHHIDVTELERASAQLFHGLTQFEQHPPEADFKIRAEAYTEKLISHHLRVQRVGQLLGGRLGDAIITQTELCIETLRNQTF